MQRISDRSKPPEKGKAWPERYYVPEFESCYPRPIRVAILQPCRRIYVEAIDILYSENFLSFRQTRTIVDLERTILPRRLDRIRSIRLSFPLNLFTIDAEGQQLAMGAWEYPLDIPYFWDAAWKILARMDSLESLQVEVTLWRIRETNLAAI